MERYSRQVLFRGIRCSGQERLRASTALVAGCGALGSVSSEMLVRAGVGRVKVVDRDYVELSNLQRQSLFTEEDALSGAPKAVAAARSLHRINSEVEIIPLLADITPDTIESLADGTDIIVDGSDNFELRFLLNDFSVQQQIPWIYGAALGSYGLASAIVPSHTPCFRCLFENPPEPGSTESCESVGILAPVIHIVASYQVTQVLKILTGNPIESGLLRIDVWENDWRWIKTPPRLAECRCCGERDFEFLRGAGQALTTRLCGRNTVQVNPGPGRRVDLEKLSGQLQEAGGGQLNDYLLRFRSDRFEIALFRDGRAIIKGTDDPAEARSVYSRFVGN